MEITYKIDLTKQNEDDQTVYFTLTDDSQQAYDFHADISKDADIQAHLDANMEKYLFVIRRKEYPDARFDITSGQTELEAFEAWISAGCVNTAIIKDEVVIEPERVIEKVPFAGTHPVEERIIDGKKISTLTQAEIDNATTVEDLKAVLKEILLGRP